MTSAQQKMGAAVLQEQASMERRSLQRYKNAGSAEASLAPYLRRAEALEACLAALLTLTPSDQ